MRIRRGHLVSAAIPTASMADIAFLLIIFFMVTTKFDVDRTQVSLPVSSYREDLPKGSAFVVIHKYEDGTFGYKFSNGEDMSIEIPDLTGLSAQVSATTASKPGLPYVIKAGGGTPYRLIDEAMDMLRRAGVETVILLTEQRTVESEG